MRSVGLVAVIAVVALVGGVGPACAWEYSIDAGGLAAGGVGGAWDNGANQAVVNPAGLARFGAATPDGVYRGLGPNPLDRWQWQLQWTQDMENDDDYGVLQAVGRKPGANWGMGFGYVEDWDDKMWNIGYGREFKSKGPGCGWSWGANLVYNDYDWTTGRVTLDAGLLYVNSTNTFGGGNFGLGLVARDILDQYDMFPDMGTYFNVSGSLMLDNGLDVGVDWIDLTDATEIAGNPFTGGYFNMGARYQCCPYFTAAVGSCDSDFTWGFKLEHKRMWLAYGTLNPDLAGAEDWDLISLGYKTTR